MTRKHLGTAILALATLTLAPSWPAAALAQTTFTVAGGLNLASVAVSEDEGLTPESVTRRRTRTSRCSSPRRTMLRRYVGGRVPNPIRSKRSSNTSSAIRPSRRASGARRQ